MPDIDKPTFFSTVIHELRAPLNACLMSVSLLELKANDPAQVARCVEVLKRNLDRQARLVHDLADVLEIAAGGIELKPERTDLQPLVDEAVERATEKGLGPIVWQRPEEVRVAQVDTDRLVSVIEMVLEHERDRVGPDTAISIGLEGEGGSNRLVVAREDPRDEATQRHDQKGFAVRLEIIRHIAELHGGAFRLIEDGAVVEFPSV